MKKTLLSAWIILILSVLTTCYILHGPDEIHGDGETGKVMFQISDDGNGLSSIEIDRTLLMSRSQYFENLLKNKNLVRVNGTIEAFSNIIDVVILGHLGKETSLAGLCDTLEMGRSMGLKLDKEVDRAFSNFALTEDINTLSSVMPCAGDLVQSRIVQSIYHHHRLYTNSTMLLNYPELFSMYVENMSC